MRSTVKLEGDVIQVDNDSSVEATEIACGETFATKRKVDGNTIVEKEGYNYFVVDNDYAKGDRRCDGKFMADFFTVVDTEDCITSVLRQSQRVQQKRSLAETLLQEGEGFESTRNVMLLEGRTAVDDGSEESNSFGLVIQEQEETRYITTNLNAGCEGQDYMEGVSGNILPPEEVEEFDMTKFGKGLRRPEEGIRCAGRKGTTRLLWLHEFYVVNEGTSSKPKRVLYQALQFLLGVHVPVGQVHCMTPESSRDIWVLGIRHVDVAQVRHSSPRTKGYLFHDEFNEGDARTALLGSCPELVRIENGLQWHNMQNIYTEVPRVVHPDDVRHRKVHVRGRKKHYVCGVTAEEDVLTNEFSFTLLHRDAFCMYPEERLGMELNSASMMWEHIEDIFRRIRKSMSSGRQGTSSATFAMPLLGTVYQFWKVRTVIFIVALQQMLTITITHCRS